MNVAELPRTRRLNEKRRQVFNCLTCGRYSLVIEVYRARVAYCPNCKQTFIFNYNPEEYVCPTCKSQLRLLECYVVSGKCGRCKYDVTFTSTIDDWYVYWNLVYDILMKRVQPGTGFLLTVGQPNIITRPKAATVKPTANTGKKFTLSDEAKQRIREKMKQKWQDPEFRKKVVEKIRDGWAKKKSVGGVNDATS
jgi:hypothetical protein